MVPARKKANEPSVTLPLWVSDLESFRRWSDHRKFPEVGHVYYLDGVVHVDISKEQIFTHAQVKVDVGYTLVPLVKIGKRGRIYFDSVYVTNEDADLSCVPDGVFISSDSVAANRVRYIEGREAGFVELEGSPDMVLEIVSDRSVFKDTVRLKELYWKAGIKEYWLIDARGDHVAFTIYRRGDAGYVETRRQGGWLKSRVFGKAFRFTQQAGPDGQPEYTLEMQ